MNYGFESLPENDTLTKSLFHHTLMAFYAPARWPLALVVLALAALAAFVGAVWWWLSGETSPAVVAALLIALAMAVDVAILVAQRRARIAFGLWPGQIAALALPRTALALAVTPLGLWLGWPAAVALLAGIQLAGVVVLARATLVEPHRLTLSRLDVPTDRLPAGTPPVRILHISDIHLERPGVREEQLLALAKETAPDLILITGDYVNLSYNLDGETHAAVRCLLGQLSARYGVFAVLGTPAVDLEVAVPPLFDGLPVRLLRDEAVAVPVAGGTVTLLGLDCHHDIARDAATLERVLASAPDNGPRILLYHSPDLMPDAVRRGIDLHLCGHTHGGQVRLPLIGPLLTASSLGRRYVMGHYREGRTHLYVSRGIGFEGLSAPRVRLLCPPEVALLTLGSAGALAAAP
ncbi:MAG TPA: metallophosphoesterase [Promineifilum sp.]|nr:metallophosphoesterase [Promineifilum sp.]